MSKNKYIKRKQKLTKKIYVKKMKNTLKKKKKKVIEMKKYTKFKI